MASSNIKLFDENKGNMLTDTEFNISTQRLNGLQTGVASSQLQNKAMYQASLVAYAIAQVMMQNGKNANDTDAVSTFVSNLSNTMLQKVYDLATTEEAKAGVATGKWMSPALVKTVINYMKATTAEAQAGTDDTKWMSPASVKTVIDNSILSKVYPVGSVYISVDNTYPGEFIGGTWERIKNVFLLSAGEMYDAGTTGGEATHTLTVAEMPSHTHSINITNGYGVTSQRAAGGDNSSGYARETSATGGDQAHNNMPPYLVVYMWKRTA